MAQRSNHLRSRRDDENGSLRDAGRSGYRECPQDRQQCSASLLARPCARNFRYGLARQREFEHPHEVDGLAGARVIRRSLQ
jgi:hypothetical protein